MASSPLVAFIILLIIGVVLTSNQNAPPLLSSMGGILALVGGLGFAFYVLRLLKVWK